MFWQDFSRAYLLKKNHLVYILLRIVVSEKKLHASEYDFLFESGYNNTPLSIHTTKGALID